MNEDPTEMELRLQFYKLAKESLKNGKYRKTRAQTRSGPAQAGSAYQPIGAPPNARSLQGAFTPNLSTGQLGRYPGVWIMGIAPGTVGLLGLTVSKVEIPAGSLKVGEITAHRAWRWASGYLYSIAHAVPWIPKRTMVGDPTTGYAGVYAWKSAEALRDYRQKELTGFVSEPIVVGEVELWGTVDEYELGYRAQYAYPKKFTSASVFPDGRVTNLYEDETSFLEMLKAKYETE